METGIGNLENIPNNMEYGFEIKAASDTRIRSIDILRGIVMVLMAIDHVRVYSGIPAWGIGYGIFLTRWITNFCAPAFTFLAGASAFLYGKRAGTLSELSKYLLGRGLMLVILELTAIRFLWTFNFNYSNFLLAGIIWMLGWCMVILAAVVRLKPRSIAIAGLFVILFQNLFGLLPKLFPLTTQKYAGYAWEFIYPAGLHSLPGVTILYVLVPWIGVMMAGYGFGSVFLKNTEVRRKICLWTGLSSITLFILIGCIVALTQEPEYNMPFLQRLLAQQKYPASQLFLLMTLGPLITAIPFAERITGWLGKVFYTFGKVPLFYYMVHIPVIHLGSLIIVYLKDRITFPGWYDTAPFVEMPAAYQWSLPLLYAEFIGDVAFLYLICAWYVRYKHAHPEKKWLRYF
jgi:uncharacterized membrane protein